MKQDPGEELVILICIGSVQYKKPSYLVKSRAGQGLGFKLHYITLEFLLAAITLYSTGIGLM